MDTIALTLDTLALKFENPTLKSFVDNHPIVSKSIAVGLAVPIATTVGITTVVAGTCFAVASVCCLGAFAVTSALLPCYIVALPLTNQKYMKRDSFDLIEENGKILL
ncbi:hypothetical protein HDV01_007045 [Terramyces sp. JEL0728]|nr:hypothetical protein HDV01_007045 [Terramyces sp. JEL0728]